MQRPDRLPLALPNRRSYRAGSGDECRNISIYLTLYYPMVPVTLAVEFPSTELGNRPRVYQGRSECNTCSETIATE